MAKISICLAISFMCLLTIQIIAAETDHAVKPSHSAPHRPKKILGGPGDGPIPITPCFVPKPHLPAARGSSHCVHSVR